MATDAGEYDAIYNYLFRHQYPCGANKVQKRALRKKAEKYKVRKGHLFYKIGKKETRSRFLGQGKIGKGFWKLHMLKV